MKELLSGLGNFDIAAYTAIRILIIAIAAWVIARVLRRVVRTFPQRLAARVGDTETMKRAETIGRVFSYVVTVIISLITGILILAELGISVAPILGAAGVVGIAVGFGAQSLVKDYFTGFFLLLENQIRQGDIVEVAGRGGVVEEVTLRFVRLRDYEGNVHYVPNGLITTVTNRSRDFAQAVIEVGIAYRENVDEAFAVMRKVAEQLRADEDFGPRIIDDLDIAGVDSWADSAVMLRCRLKVLPSQQWGVRREFLRRLKHAFDQAGIEIPYPHLTVYAGSDKDGSAPPFRIVQEQAAAAG